ncbi:glycosyltransferase [Neptunomonas phycophila]|uniref:Glycosyltransferase n=1 Tax=Neptunomonas phycophila TaxID=1572645 RepID=A0AAW7XJ96_9GAMM|nr:glycosyltransferase [Neptunomonas phycophila]MDO6454349.1 glycosyltransferase [Neptunomonas phycophila]
MIFVSVGTQLPFPRMMKIINEWAGNQTEVVVAQTAEVYSEYLNLESYSFLDAMDFTKYYEAADVIVSHAGMGNIINALQANKPIIIFPRDAALKEHRNDHQKSTARKFANKDGIYVVETRSEFVTAIENIKKGVLQKDILTAPKELESYIIKAIDDWSNK